MHFIHPRKLFISFVLYPNKAKPNTALIKENRVKRKKEKSREDRGVKGKETPKRTSNWAKNRKNGVTRLYKLI